MNLSKLNSYQTPLEEIKTQYTSKQIPKEVYDDLLEYLSTIKFVQNLIAPEEVRGFAVDRPRETAFYGDGRVNVDLTNPHILEDMDFFRQPALFFERNGRYTNIPTNSNPKSEYAQYWKDELKKWKHGMVRPSDGEWIPGTLYFYWNYSPIWLVEKVESKSTSKKQKGERVRKFPKPWLGDYLYFHYTQQAKDSGRHGKVLKTRGIGFSFKNAAESPRNMYVYPGSGNPNFHLASDKAFLTGDKGIWGKILDTLDWVAEHTPLPKMRIVDGKKAMELQLGYTDEYGNRKGNLASVFGISLKDNPDKARGIRGPLIHYEEDGLFPNLEKAWNVNRKAVEDGDVGFGFMLAGGTGGTIGASFAGSEKLFYKPNAYNIYGIPNVFDKNTNGENECGFFWGAYLNRNGCYNERTGEPDITKALVEILMDRFTVKYNSNDAMAITQKMAEECVTPQDAIMRIEGTVFPVADLKAYLESIAPKRESFLAEHYVGELILDALGSVIWMPNSKISPLRSYDSVDTNKAGCLEIYEMPRKNAEGQIPFGRYIAGIDPIDSDTGQSLFSIIVLDTFVDRIVAEYTGRPRLAVEAYEIAYRTLKFYNAQANYEANLKGLFSYFDQKNALHLLCDVPQVLKDMDMVKATNLYGNKSKGTHANKEINKWGRLLQAQWLQSKAHGDDEDERLNMHRVRSIPYIEECIAWNINGNFDRVSAAGMLFILREDRFKMTNSARANQDRKITGASADPFFTRNYNTNKTNSYNWMDGVIK